MNDMVIKLINSENKWSIQVPASRVLKYMLDITFKILYTHGNSTSIDNLNFLTEY